MALAQPILDARGAKPLEEIDDFWHTGAQTLAGQYLRRFWQPVAQVGDILAAWSKPIRVLGEDLTLYRGVSGKPYVVAYRCAHRGTRLSTGSVDGEGIRCSYHGWKYDGNGQCVDQPSEPRSFAERVRVKSYPCREYLGLLFAYLGEGEPPPLPHYPHFEADGVVVTHGNDWPFNYFQHLENAMDEVHIGFLHAKSPYQGSINAEVPRISAEETEFGLVQYGERSKTRRATYYHMPNMTSWAQPPGYPEETGWRDMLGWRVPADDYSHNTFTVTHARVPIEQAAIFLLHRKTENEELAKLRPFEEIAGEVLAGTMRFRDIPNRGNGADLTRIQDRIIMVGQGEIVDRPNETLGAADVAVQLLRRIWRRELMALRDGKPLKQWARSIPAPNSGA
ncbi:MAG: Rieske 2Fe-2S domain-containing protein [Burkholderiales bacterium]